MVHLPNLDLNLMTAFDALLTHRHVTKAGDAIGRSQPAMSHALGRLRVLLDDQLLIKSRDGMVPTPKALKIHDQIHRALVDIENAVNDRDAFDPGTASQTFTIAMVEHAAFVLMPSLAARLSKEAPGIDLNIVTVNSIPGVEQLDAGGCELAIALQVDDLPSHIASELIYQERFVSVTRDDHPILSSPYELDDYLTYPHAAIRTSRDAVSQVDMALQRLGKRRRVAVGISHVLMINMMLAKSELIASLPERNAAYFAPTQNLAIREIPFDVPAFETHMAWHQRHHDDPAHRWLRQTIKMVASDI